MQERWFFFGAPRFLIVCVCFAIRDNVEEKVETKEEEEEEAEERSVLFVFHAFYIPPCE